MFLRSMWRYGKPPHEFLTERIATGPLFEASMILLGKGDKYDYTYDGGLKPSGARTGKLVSDIIPYARLLKYLKTTYDPVKRVDYDEYQGFLANVWMGFAARLPGISNFIAPKIDAEGNPITIDPENEFAKFWIPNIKNPDAEDYNRAIIYLLQRLQRLDYKAYDREEKEAALGFDYGSKEVLQEMEDIEDMIDKLEKIESKLIRLKSKVSKRRNDK